MHRSRALGLVLLAGTVAACSLPRGGSPAASYGSGAMASAEGSSATASAAAGGTQSSPAVRPTAPNRVPLPTGFPVPPDATPLSLPDDDSGLIGRWGTDQFGATAYDFYLDALPDAGYPILGQYPGDSVGVIRFRAPDGATWQMVVHPADGVGFIIEIRLDRP